MWSLLYALSLMLSSLSSGCVVVTIYRNKLVKLSDSAVMFMFFFLLLYMMLWSLFRALFYVVVVSVSRDTLDEIAQVHDDLVDLPYFDAVGLRSIAHTTKPAKPFISVLLVLGDTMLVACSLWLFPMTHELAKLATTSMDRGVQKEQQTTRKYGIVMHVFIFAFVIFEAGFAWANGGYDYKLYNVLVIGYSVQLLALVYAAFSLIRLRLKGKSLENVHGGFAPSPLYNRIMRIMLGYFVFACQYLVLSMVMLFGNFRARVPVMYLGITTLLFNNTGTALAILMGCSQECVARKFRNYLPDEYTQQFHASENFFSRNVSFAPAKDPVFVYTDIEASSALWAIENGQLMRVANELHDDLLRLMLLKYHGYEITTCGDSFQLAFHCVQDAVEYCLEVQKQLLQVKWSKKLLKCGVPAIKKERVRGKVVFRGLRVRMGIHDAQECTEGVLVSNRHPVTGRVTYTGMSEVIANEIGELGHGGQVLVTSRIAQWILEHKSQLACGCEVQYLTSHHIVHVNEQIDIYQVIIRGLEARTRFFTQDLAVNACPRLVVAVCA